MAARLSIVVPALDESEGISALFEEIRAACSACEGSWEVIFVDDGSTDGSWEIIEALARENPEVRGLRLRRNFGKSAALASGIAASRGEVVVTMDGDGQDDPAEIPGLVAELDAGYDLVSGWKRDRRDPLSRRIASRVFNAVTKRVSGVRIHDLNCGLKAYRGECARSLELYGELHRFVAVLAAQQGWRVGELPVRHRPRPHGSSRFGSERFARGLLDLVTVSFLGRYQNRPLHLFGGLGLLSALAGFLICVYLTIDKISGASIGDRPLLVLGILLIVVGVQLASFGLLGQMMAAIRVETPRGKRQAGQVAEDVGGGLPAGHQNPGDAADPNR
jgi:glycosyltransferase involved in cell wall biosynthesis